MFAAVALPPRIANIDRAARLLTSHGTFLRASNWSDRSLR